MRRLTEFTWNYYLEHPEFLTLLNSANLHRARHLEGSKRARELNTPLIATLGEVLERGRAEGIFRGGKMDVYATGTLSFCPGNNLNTFSLSGQACLRRR